MTEVKKACCKKKPNSNMYADVKTWNPFKGCKFDCEYCKPSFQLQAKRQKNRCTMCYNFEPHTHPDRLDKIPSADTIFVCGNGDISFCDPKFTIEIIESIKKDNLKKRRKTFFLQSKRPTYFQQFLDKLPDNVKLITTLETNRDIGYKTISKAPVPSIRYKQFLELNYPHKILTVEPIMDFDLKEFVKMIIDLKPELVHMGVNSRHKSLQLLEPTPKKFEQLKATLIKNGINIKMMNDISSR